MSSIAWQTVKEYEDITYKKYKGVARIAFNRPEIRNAFRPKTTFELYDAFEDAAHDPRVGVVLLSGEGPSPKDGIWSFCSGGDQNARNKGGYRAEDGRDRLNTGGAAPDPVYDQAGDSRGSGLGCGRGA